MAEEAALRALASMAEGSCWACGTMRRAREMLNASDGPLNGGGAQ